MKITFIDPPNFKTKIPVERVFGCNLTIYPIPNIFILTVAAILKNNGYQVDYIDAANMGWKEKDFLRFLEKDNSDILSIHSVNLSKESDLDSVKKIRKARGSIPVVFTGPAPTQNPKDYLFDNNCFVIRGEPEFTFLDLAEKLSCRNHKDLPDIRGLSFLDISGPSDNLNRLPIDNLDMLPFPERKLLNKKLYFNPKLGRNPWTAVLTSRGCSFRCIFCVPCSLSFAREIEYKRFYKRKPPVRLRGIENVIDEFRFLKGEGYKAVSIIDDNFTWGEQRVIKICEGIKDLRIVWGCLSRADLITEKIARAMASANCRYVDIGVESFDQKILDYVNKGLKVEDIFKAIKILKNFNIDAKLNILIGASPLETKETILKNIEITKRLKPTTVMFSIVSPFPGTDYYNICKENGWFKHGDYIATNIQKQAVVNYPYLSCDELEDLVKKANYDIYLDTHVIWKALKKAKSPRMLLRGLIAYLRKLRFN